ncbi:MAG TPA: hypothetical protein VHM31_09820 [Polyangia bacterium]|nr:hypothetical protein [Polyangia bacterium]
MGTLLEADASDSGDVSVAVAHQLCMLASFWHCLQDVERRDTAIEMVALLLQRSPDPL